MTRPTCGATKKTRTPRPVDPYIVDLLVSGIPEKATVAERVEAIRRMPHLSAEEQAVRLGVTLRSISRYRARLREAT